MLDVGRHRSWWPHPPGSQDFLPRFSQHPSGIRKWWAPPLFFVGVSVPGRVSCSGLLRLHSALPDCPPVCASRLGSSASPACGSELRLHLAACRRKSAPSLLNSVLALGRYPSSSGPASSPRVCLALSPASSQSTASSRAHCTLPPIGVNRLRLSSSSSLTLMPLRSHP